MTTGEGRSLPVPVFVSSSHRMNSKVPSIAGRGRGSSWVVASVCVAMPEPVGGALASPALDAVPVVPVLSSASWLALSSASWLALLSGLCPVPAVPAPGAISVPSAEGTDSVAVSSSDDDSGSPPQATAVRPTTSASRDIMRSTYPQSATLSVPAPGRGSGDAAHFVDHGDGRNEGAPLAGITCATLTAGLTPTQTSASRTCWAARTST
jgi:hypothetical protein